MKRMWFAKCLSLFFSTLMLFALAPSLQAGDFTADVVETHGGKVETYKVLVSQGRYLLQMREDGKQLHIIVNPAANLTRIVIPAEKIYYELPADNLFSLINNPFQSAQVSASRYETRSLGRETLQGFDCSKTLIHSAGQDLMTLWTSDESLVPLKLSLNSDPPRQVELVNLKSGAVDAALLQIPGDFKKKPHPSQKRRAPDPATLFAVTGSVSGKAPWGRRVKAGAELRVEVDKTRKARVRVINLLKSEAEIVVLPFHQGKQRENIGVTPRKLEYKGSSFSREFNKDRDMFGSSFAVDEVVIKVSKGLAHVVVDQPGKEVRDLYNRGGVTTWERLSPDRATRLSMTGDNPDGDTTSGKILVRNDKAKTREDLPFEVKNGETKVWTFDADKGYDILQITVPSGQGSMRIRIDESGTKAAAAPSVRAVSTPATKPVAKPTPAATAKVEPARMVLVLDASGSMWGQIKGKAKITIAKAVMADLIRELPTDFQTGLMVYGHRRKGDCDDIEMLMPVGPHNAVAMNAKVQGISPKGKTPLSESVRQAAKALRYTEERASVVLVSDGLETCHADPCALAAELAMSGVDFTVHVIGFDISQEEQTRLRCMADRTGGLFLAASDAQTLRDALSKTLDEVREPPPPVVKDPGEARLTGPASVPVGAAFQVGWEGPDSHNDYVAIAQKEPRDSAFIDYAYTSIGNPLELVAPGKAGEYELRYLHAHSSRIIGRRVIQVTPVQAEVKAPPSANVASEIEVAWSGPAYRSDYITIAKVGDVAGRYDNYAYTSKGTPAKLWAPAEPGQYEVRYILSRGTQMLARAPITVKSVTAQVQTPATANAAARFEVTWQGPDNKGDYITIANPEDVAGRYDNYAYTHKGSPATLTAPSEPGVYEVRYIQARGTKMLASAPITIQAVSAQVRPPATANAAAGFEVTWQGPDNKGDYITIANPEDVAGRYDNYAYTRKGTPAKLLAPSEPGQYEVRYIQAKGTKLLAKSMITVNAVSAEVVPPVSAKAGEYFQVAWQGPAYQSDYITVALSGDSPGRYDNYVYTRTGSPARLKAPTKPGEYEVRYIMARGTKILAKRALKVIK
ncbi:MAG: VWA domain-containing protein [gamma proteobacterium endosymbiont of Lamellibrachia anaximandri]|nr:VWA domain-containing protein [gamma proteobacterium endosymbiont of Lamellibrachia anaximandri]